MITGLHVKNFKCFEDLRIEKFYGVNLILGVNETGKTSLMKLMYATLLSQVPDEQVLEFSALNSKNPTQFIAIKAVLRTFNGKSPRDEELFYQDSTMFDVEVGYIENSEHSFIQGTFDTTKEEYLIHFRRNNTDVFTPILKSTLFIPAKEIMSIYDDIEYIVEKRRSSGFDLTYENTAKALRRSKVGANKIAVGVELVEEFDNIFESKVRYSEEYQDFFMTVNGKDLTTSSIPEGIRKTSTIANLLNADEIQPGDVLFIDEPENNLHPRAQRAFMEALVKLSQAGVQVFMASHSYTVLSQLELIAQRDGIDIGCYSLLRDEQTKAIRLASSNLREAMPENDIVTEGIRQLEDSYTLDLQDYGR